MGIYLDPGNSGFQEVVRSEYVDKTGLIDLVNHTIGTSGKLTCISRPRRFGKSFAAQMLCAYYDCSCDSHGLFDDKEIAETEVWLLLEKDIRSRIVDDVYQHGFRGITGDYLTIDCRGRNRG